MNLQQNLQQQFNEVLVDDKDFSNYNNAINTTFEFMQKYELNKNNIKEFKNLINNYFKTEFEISDFKIMKNLLDSYLNKTLPINLEAITIDSLKELRNLNNQLFIKQNDMEMER